MEFGLEVAEDRYARVAIALGANPHLKQQELARKAIEQVYNYNDVFGVWTEAKSKYINDLQAYRQVIPEIVNNALSGNGILTNRKVPTDIGIAAILEKLAEKLAE